MLTVLLSCPAGSYAAQELHTVSSSVMSNNQQLACSAVCTRIGPLRSDNPAVAGLPGIIKSSLTPPAALDFGAGLPIGATQGGGSGTVNSALNGSDLNSSFGSTFNSSMFQQSPVQLRHDITMNIDQTVTGGSASSGDQTTSMIFSVESLTDSNGNLIGSPSAGQDGKARGTVSILIKEGSSSIFSQSGTFTWDTTNGWLQN